jgi:hypothetical protein
MGKLFFFIKEEMHVAHLTTRTCGVAYTCALRLAGIAVCFSIRATNRVVICGTNAVLLIVTSNKQKDADK